MSGLVLSLFPGIGLLDRAFEEEGFCVVRGPDPLWGGDIHRFHPPAGKFDGVIGGPPCQAHSTLAALNRSLGNKVKPDLIPEFKRVVGEAQPSWWLAENVPGVPDIALPGYVTTARVLDNRWLGEEQSRRRRWQFGTRTGAALRLSMVALEAVGWEYACLAGEGETGRATWARGVGVGRSTRRPWSRFCELQGLPPTFLADSPLTIAGKYQAVGNGVPLPMGRAIAKAVKAALAKEAA